MATTEHFYTGNNSTTSFAFTFPYLSNSDVKVELDNVVKTENSSGQTNNDYTINNTNIVFNSAPGTGVAIHIYRTTNVDTAQAQYAAGSSIRAADLNNNQTQVLYSAQEAAGQKVRQGDLKDNIIVSSNIIDGTITTADLANSLITTDKINDGAVTTAKIADLNVTTSKIENNTITTAKLATGVITTATIANDAVTADKIANGAINSSSMIGANVINNSMMLSNSITTGEITDGNVTTAKIAADAITGAKIADDAIDSEHLAADSIDAEHYAAGSVDTTALGTSAVTTAKIADQAVTTAKIENNTITTGKLATGVITTATIAADAVTNAKIADNSIDSEHYVDGSIDTAHIANAQVTTAKIADNNVTTGKIADQAVTTAKIENNTITTAKLATGIITTATIAADAVTNAKIADDSIDSEHYVDGSIDTAHIANTQVTDAKLASNSVTTSKITDANVTTDKIANDAITIGKIGCEQTTISNSDLHLPTSGAVVDYVAAQIAPIGGLEVIATDAAFPNTQPSAGVVISIADAGGIVVDGSGSSTTGRTVGGSTVTINGINSAYNSSTVTAGVGFLVSSTGSGQIYNFHKSVIRDQDILSISSDINDFGNRYRVGSSNPTSSLDAGDLFFNTSTQKLLVYNSTNSAWEEAQSVGNFFISTFSESFDGSRTAFTVSNAPANAQQLIISINGVIQKPNSGTGQPSEGFTLSGSTVTFSSAIPSGSDYFAIVLGSTVNIGAPSDNTVSTAKLTSGAVTTVKIADDAVTGDKIATNLDLPDNNKIRFGTGNDLQIYHDGTHSYIWDNGTGSIITASDSWIYWMNAQANETIIKGGANSQVELYYDNSKKLETTSGGIDVDGSITANDIITAGALLHEGDTDTLVHFSSADTIQLKTGGSSRLEVTTSGLALQNGYLSSNGNRIILGDSTGASDDRLVFGNNNDLQIYHDGTNSIISNHHEDLYIDCQSDDLYLKAADNIFIQPQAGENGININGNGAVELYHDNTKRLETTSNGVSIPGILQMGTSSSYIDLPDNASLYCGTGDDLRIYHDATDSFIVNSTGSLKLRSAGNINIDKQDGSEHIARFIPDSAVELYYDGSKKFETRSDGVTLTGQMVQTSSSARAIACNRQGSAGEMILFDFQGTKCGAINVNTNSTEYATSGSDRSLKKNFELWDENVLNLFKNINPQKFHFNNQEDTEEKSKGFIAQEMVDSFPEAYTKDDNNKYWFNPSGIVVYLMKAIQELETKVATLEAK